VDAPAAALESACDRESISFDEGSSRAGHELFTSGKIFRDH
jgi:hypothetical protein